MADPAAPADQADLAVELEHQQNETHIYALMSLVFTLEFAIPLQAGKENRIFWIGAFSISAACMVVLLFCLVATSVRRISPTKVADPKYVRGVLHAVSCTLVLGAFARAWKVHGTTACAIGVLVVGFVLVGGHLLGIYLLNILRSALQEGAPVNPPNGGEGEGEGEGEDGGV